MSTGIPVCRELRTSYVSRPASHEETNKGISKIRREILLRLRHSRFRTSE